MGDRSDKKSQTKPYLSIVVLEIVDDLRRYLGSISNSETACRIVLAAYEDIEVIRKLQPFLRWDFHKGDLTFIGHREHQEITTLLPGQYNRTERLPIRFTQNDEHAMEILHFALACPWAHMIGALLRLGVESHTVVQKIAPGYSYKSAASFRRGVWSR